VAFLSRIHESGFVVQGVRCTWLIVHRSSVFGSEFFTVTKVHRGSTFALRRSTLDCCLGGQRSYQTGFGDALRLALAEGGAFPQLLRA